MKTGNVSIRELQLKLLEIIDNIDHLCKKNNIEYYLIGGSALGAVRHKGFIPWDDDFDIAMTWQNYVRFIDVCEKQLDKDKFFLQKEHSHYWPSYFTKIKMNGTKFIEEDVVPNSHCGIFIDIFCLENISNGRFTSLWQYICSKIVIAQTLADRGYKSATLKKKIIMTFSSIVSRGIFKDYFIRQVRKYNNKNTDRVGLLFGKITYKNGIIPRSYLGKGSLVEFEERMLPVPVMIDQYLSDYFGDYMKLPPEEERKGHLPKIVEL